MRNGNAMNGNGAGGAPDGQFEVISELTAGRLRRLAGRIPPDELSEVWVFPPLEDVEGSDEFHLFTRRMSEGVYRVCAAEFAGDSENGAEPDAAGAEVGGKVAGLPRVTVYGAVPESRVPRLVAGFRDRLGDGRDPLYLPIYGSLERWRLAVGVDPDEATSEGADGAAADPSEGVTSDVPAEAPAADSAQSAAEAVAV